nr:hypothetical protein [uncultured Treponema sp.]
MKRPSKFIAAQIILTIAFTATSCLKKAPDAAIEPSDQKIEETTGTESLPEITETLVDAKILSPKSYLCLMGRDQKMHHILNVSYGDTLSILHENNSCITMESENEVYAKAVYKEVEYWICIDTIALQCETALVLDKASLYADKEFMLSTDEGNSPFRFGDFVCRSLTPEDESNSFDRIYYYDKGTQKVKSAYIKKDLISTRTDDIVVMDCVRQLRITKRATPRNEIFRRAARYNPCPRVAAALEAEKTEKIENNYQDVLNALPGAKYKVNVPELLTVDQSKDPFR